MQLFTQENLFIRHLGSNAAPICKVCRFLLGVELFVFVVVVLCSFLINCLEGGGGGAIM